MKATELRIGNLIKNMFEETIVVGEICESHVTPKGSNNLYGISNCSPIPLTEEWLLKFGFERDWDIETAYPAFQGLKLSIFGTGKSNEFECNESELRIKYVHQLQNLYFALTGKELTYNK